MPPRQSTRSKRPSTQALESLGASPPRGKPAEVTRQLQPASFLRAVQEPQVPSPAPAAFPSLAGTTAVQQLTTEVPEVSSSPVGNPSAVDQVTQVVQSVHSSLAGKYQLTINPGDGSSPSLALEPITKPKKIVSIDSWVQAFHVFVGVFTSRFPSDAPGLMKYGSTIQDLAARGHNWRFYDENFRFLRQTPATSLP
ncbi:unnamed protein product, partial [Porites evermanni]